MKMNSNIRTWAASSLMMLAAVVGFTACDDDNDDVKLQPAAPVVTCDVAKSSSLTFSWAPVENAFEYAYTLYDLSGIYVDGGITSATSVTIGGLESGETYTLEVVSYAQNAMHSIASETATAMGKVLSEIWRVEGTFTSADLGQSWTAVLSLYEDNHYEIHDWYGVSGYNLSFTVNANLSLNLSEYPRDNAGYRAVPTGLESAQTAYIYTSSGYSSFQGDTTEGEIYFYTKLTTGGKDTFTWGHSDVEDNSGEDSSDNTAEDVEEATALWSVEGTYTCADLGDSWTATLTAYSDGRYVLSAWMGVEGYDFIFTVNGDAEMQADASYYVDGYGYIYVPTGRSDGYTYGYLYTADGCSQFTGDATSGQFSVYNYMVAGKNDSFTWGN